MDKLEISFTEEELADVMEEDATTLTKHVKAANGVVQLQEIVVLHGKFKSKKNSNVMVHGKKFGYTCLITKKLDALFGVKRELSCGTSFKPSGSVFETATMRSTWHCKHRKTFCVLSCPIKNFQPDQEMKLTVDLKKPECQLCLKKFGELHIQPIAVKALKRKNPGEKVIVVAREPPLMSFRQSELQIPEPFASPSEVFLRELNDGVRQAINHWAAGLAVESGASEAPLNVMLERSTLLSPMLAAVIDEIVGCNQDKSNESFVDTEWFRTETEEFQMEPESFNMETRDFQMVTEGCRMDEEGLRMEPEDEASEIIYVKSECPE